MQSSHPLVKTFAAALAAVLAAQAPLLAGGVIQTRVVVPGAVPISGAAGASLANLSAQPGLTPSLAAPASLTPSLVQGLSIVPVAQPLTFTAAAAAPSAQAAPAPVALPGISVQPAAQAAALTQTLPSAVSLNKEAAAAAQTAPKGPLARVFAAVRDSLRLGRSDALFTGRGTVGSAAAFAPEEQPQESEGVRLDPKPVQPQKTEIPGVSWDKVQLPGRPSRPTLIARIFGSKSVAPVTLPGDPRDAAGVEGALRRLISERPGDFGGITSAQLATVMAHKVAGRSGMTDTVYVNFKQLQNGVEVEGTYLGFTVKIVAGQAIVVGSTAQLFPQLAVDTFGRLDDRVIIQKAAERLGHTTASAGDFNDQGVKVMHLGGQWRAVRLMLSKAKTLMAAVDINSGESFAWDPRHKLSVAGTAQGGAIADGPIESGTPSIMTLGHIEITASNGKKTFADADGKFTVEGEGDKPVQLTVKLSGRYATVEDQEHKDLVVTVTAKPGEELRVVFNPEGKDENALAQVNAYLHTTIVHDFLVKNGIDLEALAKPMLVKTNIDDECNAYYTPWSPSLNFFKSSSRCANSSYNDVNYHEYGHGVDDAAHHGIGNGGLSEAIGDMLAMMITAQPIIGRGFLKGSTPDYIRHGDNKYQYKSSGEVHEQGQAGMGFVWKLRKALIASLGELEGTAVAQALVLPAILAANKDIPAFINSVLMRDINDQGTSVHFKEIQAAAAAHGIRVKQPKPGQVNNGDGWVETDSWFSKMTSSWGAAAQFMLHR